MEYFQHIKINLMIKTSAHFVFSLVFGFQMCLNAQTFDFENWEATFQKLPAETERIDGIYSTNNIFNFAGLSFTKSEKSFNGNFSAALQSKQIFGQVYQAGLSMGTMKPDYSNLKFDVNHKSLTPYGNINSVEFQFKYANFTVLDSCYIELAVFSKNSLDKKYEYRKGLPPNQDWQNFNHNFVYNFASGDSMQLFIYSSLYSADAILYIDDLTFKSKTVNNVEVTSQKSVKIFPNLIKAYQDQIINCNLTLDKVDLALYNSLGQKITKLQAIDDYNIILPALSSGIYFIQIGYQQFQVIVN